MDKEKKILLNEHESAEIKHLSERLVNVDKTEALANYVRLEFLLNNRDFSTDQEAYVTILNRLGEYHGRNKDNLKAEEYFFVLRDYGEKTHNKGIIFRAKSNLAIVKAQLGFYHEAIEIWQEVLASGVSKKLERDLCNNICVGYGCLDKYSEAIEYGYRSIAASEELNQPEDTVSTYANLGIAYNYLGNHEKALEVLLKAYKLAQDFKNYRRETECCNNLSVVYNEMGDTETALDYANRCLVIQMQYSSEHESANALNNIGYINECAGNLSEALIFYKAALKIFMDDFDLASKANTLINIGKIFKSYKDFQEAIQYLDEGVKLARELGVRHLVENALRIYIEVYSQLGHFEEALKCSKEIIEIKEEGYSKLSKNTVSIAEANYYRQKIERQAELYHKQNIELLKTNKTIRQKTRQVAEANEELNSINQIHNSLIRVISHDVRAPLGNIYQALNLINENGMDDEDRKEMLLDLQESSGEIYSLLNEMLDWIISQRKQISHEPNLQLMDVVPILRNVFVFYSSLAKQKHVNFSISLEHECMAAIVDQEMLKIATRNIFSNSLKYTQGGGKIGMNVSYRDDLLCISVSDDGIGMNLKEIKKLTQGKLTSSRGTAMEIGSGIGFGLCKDSVRKMRGKLNITSEKGKGTTIEILLPRS
ncbi:MAG: tetratricopeptide repeat protein [Candidatus Cloacimonetes bacterium]|nr:tetratricopeptide repeat protein [Candidatus Cloacimonadota bacterium]